MAGILSHQPTQLQSTIAMPSYLQPTNLSPAMGPAQTQWQDALWNKQKLEQQQALDMFAQQKQIETQQAMALERLKAALAQPATPQVSTIGGRRTPSMGGGMNLSGDMMFPQRPVAPRPGPDKDVMRQIEQQIKLQQQQQERDYMAELKAKIQAEKELARFQAQQEAMLQAKRHKQQLEQIALNKQPVRENMLLGLIGNLL